MMKMSKTTSSFFDQIATTFATVSKQLSKSPERVVAETKSILLKELKTQRLPAAEDGLKVATELHNELSAMKSRRLLAKMPGSKHLRLPSEEFDKHFQDVPDQDILNARRRMLEKKQDLANIKALIQKFSQPSPTLEVVEPTSSGSTSGPTNGNGPR